MKIAVFSDIHGNLEALDAIITSIKKEGINMVFCLGDVTGKGPNPKECLDLIIENKIALALGNSELYYLFGTAIDEMSDEEVKHFNWVSSQLNDKHKKFLEECNLNITLKLDRKTISFRHFLIDDINKPYPFYLLKICKDGTINKLVNELSDDYVIIGHEHKEFTIIGNNTTLIDVGSSGCVKNNKTQYHIIDINGSFSIKRVEIEYDRAKLISKINNSDYPNIDKCKKAFGV